MSLWSFFVSWPWIYVCFSHFRSILTLLLLVFSLSSDCNERTLLYLTKWTNNVVSNSSSTCCIANGSWYGVAWKESMDGPLFEALIAAVTILLWRRLENSPFVEVKEVPFLLLSSVSMRPAPKLASILQNSTVYNDMHSTDCNIYRQEHQWFLLKWWVLISSCQKP